MLTWKGVNQSGEVAEEEGRRGWDVTWVQAEELEGRMRERKTKTFLFFFLFVVTFSILPAVLKLTWCLEEYNSSQKGF